MNFFCTKKECQDWIENSKLSETGIYCLDINDGFDVAKMIFEVK